MKKSLFVLIIIILAIIFSVYGWLLIENTKLQQVKKENREYEYYLGKTLLGTEVTSLMNKAIDKNEQNKIPKNEKGHYIENEENSIKIDVEMITTRKYISNGGIL